MDWSKAKSDRFLDNELRMVLGKRYITGIYTLDSIERIVAWHFGMSKWSNQIIEALAKGKKFIPPMQIALPYDVFVSYMTPNRMNEDEVNDIFDMAELLSKHKYLVFKIDIKRNAVILDCPQMMSGLSEWVTKNIWQTMKKGDLPFEHVKKHLDHDMRERFTKNIAKLSSPEEKDIAMNGSESFKQKIETLKTTTESFLEKETKFENNPDVYSESNADVVFEGEQKIDIPVNEKFGLTYSIDTETGEVTYKIKDRVISKEEYEKAIAEYS